MIYKTGADGNIYKELRRKKGLSQVEVAKALSIVNTAVSKWERGLTIPDQKMLPKIAELYGTTVDYLLTGKENPAESFAEELLADIKIRLKAQNLTYEKLAGMTGISISTIKDILRGATANPRVDTIQAILRAINMPDMDRYPSEPILRYPIIGTIRAGYGGVPLEEFTDEWQEVPASIIKGHKKEDFFVLEIVGTSMYPRFLEGDRVLVKRCSSVDSGDIAVFIYDGNEATVKKVNYVPGEDWMEFIPYNPEYPTKRISGPALQETWVLGKVVYMFRKV